MLDIEEKIAEKWLPPTKALRENVYPEFHKILLENGRGDLSFKINKCNVDGLRLDCPIDPSHYNYLPVSCNRRICPSCARSDMIARINRYNFPDLFKLSSKFL